jgi:hypothetical protein
MKLNLSLSSAVLAACLFAANLACAQTSDGNPAIVHTVSLQEYGVPGKAGVSTRVLRGNEAFSVASTGIKGPIAIGLGWMPAQPNTTYQTRYRLRAQALEAGVRVYVMIREHERKNAQPIRPYHTESARSRDVKPESRGAWIERQLTFTTGDKTRALSGSIVVVDLKGELHFSPLELLATAKLAAPKLATPDRAAQTVASAKTDATQTRAQAEAEYKQVMTEIRAQAAARVPLTPRPLVFSRSQVHYDLGQYYYHKWNDRPLFASRAYRMPSPYMIPLSSFKRTLQEVVNYDIDGLAFFPETRGRMDVFEMKEKAGVPGLQIMPEFLGGGIINTPQEALRLKLEALRQALKSPSTPRINGKLLITSYNAQNSTPAQWKELLDTLRAEVGDSFIFLPALSNVAALHSPFMAGEPISRAAIEKERAFLRSYLDVCDGIYFHYPPSLRNKDHTFDGDFYRDIFIPVFKSVLSEPAYRGKYLGLSAYRSHMAPDRGNSLHEDGTRTLRRSFEAAMEARPDVIVMPEWDEQNENTSFRPTIYGGRTTERVVRYYMSQIKQKAPTPLPGDDVSIPNLILSTRKAAVLGESLNIELLNVPDSTTPGSYSVELALQDATGKVVHSFKPVTLNAAKLQEHRFSLATETIPAVEVLVPVLTVRGYKGRDSVFDSGFHHTQVRATWNWDYLYVRQPLRDLLPSTSAKIAWEAPASSGAPLMLTGSVSSPEDLNLVEVLGDDDEAYAVDPTNEFFRDDPSREVFLVEYRSVNSMSTEGDLALKNADAEWITNELQSTPKKFPVTREKFKGDRIHLKSPVSVHQRWIYLAIPKANIAAAELDFNLDKAKFTVPLREVLEKKMIARGFENGLHISIRPYYRQLDMPLPLNKKEVSFRVQIHPEIATEQYQLRLTALNGKLFYSRPLLLPSSNSGAQKKLRVYSDTQKRGIDVQVAADRIPELKYEFAPERGAVLLTGADRPFWATLGGFTNSTTGRGAVNSLWSEVYPEKTERSAPTWENIDGKPALSFDGVGTYLELPREALPLRGAFTLGFDIRPASAQNQVLLTNRVVGSMKGLSLEIRDGKLYGTFIDTTWKSQLFPTNLAIPVNAWSTIKVRYDFEKLTFSVNGKSESFPQSLPASSVGFTIIGEGWKGNWFKGDVRNLHITHNAE